MWPCLCLIQLAKWPNFGSWPQLSAAECWPFINISSLLPVFYIWYNVHACSMWYLSFWWDSAESISNSNMSSFSSLLAMVKCKMCYSHNIFKLGSNLFCLSFSLLQPSPGVLAVVSMLTATTKLQWVCVISASPAAAPHMYRSVHTELPVFSVLVVSEARLLRN